MRRRRAIRRTVNVRDYGAVGNGRTLDTGAINRAIDAAARAGGGKVRFPRGIYLSFSIRLRSRITLQLERGCTLLAATPSAKRGGYDPAEPNPWGDKHLYQDFGHSHWHNSLIWGEDLEDVTICGPGLIHGRGLNRAVELGTATQQKAFGPNNTPLPGAARTGLLRPPPGLGNKAIALKRCRHVVLRDFSMLACGHFAVLATGVDDLRIDNLRVDTNRDGLDLDSCRHARITNCTVNAPNDDAIVLKSSYALGEPRACEDIVIRKCRVSGYDVGSMLAGTFGRRIKRVPDSDGPTGRIKLGTESNGGFRKIRISDCVFARSRGLAIETVDGGVISDVVATNLKMREVTTAPLFLRVGNRARGPAGTPVGVIRRVTIRGVVAEDVDARYPILLAGLKGRPLEKITLRDIRMTSRGGLTLRQVVRQPAELVNPFFLRDGLSEIADRSDPFAVPERERGYPEPSMFGLLPACGLYARHVRGLRLGNFRLRLAKPDDRPRIVLDQVSRAALAELDLPRGAEAVVSLKDDELEARSRETGRRSARILSC